MTRMIPYILLTFSVLALSQAGNLVKLCETNPISIAFYRLFFAFLILLPFSYRLLWKNLAIIKRKDLFVIILMGMTFALHFFAWFIAVKATKVANAAMCFSFYPVFSSLGAFFLFKERPSLGTLIAIISGILGLILVGLDDVSFSSSYLFGDLMAVVGGLCFAIYFIIGKSLRNRFDNLFLMPLVFLTGSVLSCVVMFTFDLPFFDFGIKTALALMSLVLFPTLLGHASLIYVLKRFKVSLVSTATLAEPVLAGIVAFFLFGERLTTATIAGYFLIALGLLCMIYFPEKAKKGISS